MKSRIIDLKSFELFVDTFNRLIVLYDNTEGIRNRFENDSDYRNKLHAIVIAKSLFMDLDIHDALKHVLENGEIAKQERLWKQK